MQLPGHPEPLDIGDRKCTETACTHSAYVAIKIEPIEIAAGPH